MWEPGGLKGKEAHDEWVKGSNLNGYDNGVDDSITRMIHLHFTDIITIIISVIYYKSLLL